MLGQFPKFNIKVYKLMLQRGKIGFWIWYRCSSTTKLSTSLTSSGNYYSLPRLVTGTNAVHVLQAASQRYIIIITHININTQLLPATLRTATRPRQKA